MKDILVLSENKKWKNSLAELLKKGNDLYPIKVTFVSTRTDIISELSIHFYDAVVLNSGLPIINLQIIFKYLASTDYKNSPLFFISENFSEFETLLTQSQFTQLQLIAAPIEDELIAKNIQHTLYPPNTTGSIDTEVKINLDFLKIFIDATKYILESFCQLKNVSHKKPYLYDKATAETFGIEGKISLQSEFFEGAFIIGLSKKTYLTILEMVLAQKDKDITKENEDFAGEIVNMIYGQAKTVLNTNGHNFEKVLPTYEVNPPKLETRDPVVVVPLETDAGSIELLVHVAKIKKH